MVQKNSKKWLIVLAGVGLIAGFQQAAFAVDDQQKQADLATAAQFQQNYQNDRQALAQAYRSGDRQNIRDLQATVTQDIRHLQANSQDLSNDGVSNPSAVPALPDYGGAPNRMNREWQRRGAFPGYETPNHRWDNWSRYQEPDHRYDNWHGREDRAWSNPR